MTEDEPTDHLTMREAAEETGRTAETVRRWVWSGRLPSHKRGNRLVVTRSDLARVTGSPTTTSLAGWFDQLLAQRDQRNDETTCSAADLVLADRRRRSST